MGLMERLFGIRFPSSDWPEDPSRPLELDLTAATLSGVPLGAEMAALSFLGAAEDSRLAQQGTLVFFRKGLVVSVRARRAAGYSTIFEPPGPGDPGYIQPFAGALSLAGERLEHYGGFWQNSFQQHVRVADALPSLLLRRNQRTRPPHQTRLQTLSLCQL